MIHVDLDFETRSRCDLKRAGAEAYSLHPSTEIMCLIYNGELWTPAIEAEDMFVTLRVLATEPDYLFIAHNAGFEQAIWRNIMVPKYGFPPIPIERWDCTMAAAAWKGTPLALGKLAPAIGVKVEKDKEGNRLTLAMSKQETKKAHMELWPGWESGITKKKWLEQWEKGVLPDFNLYLPRIAAYCEQDVRVEQAVKSNIGLISEQSPAEREVWIYDQRINQRGVRLDMDFVDAAKQVVDRARGGLLTEFKDITGGIEPGQVAQLQAWCAYNGTLLDNLQKDTIAKALGNQENVDDAGYESFADDGQLVLAQSPMDPAVRRVLEIRQMLGSVSVKKLSAMQACVCPDGRARGLLQYHAAGTGRWGGRLLQPQNFPRGDWNKLGIDPEQTVDAIMSGDPELVEILLGVPAIEAVGASLRHALIPDPGSVFLVGDYAGIEARIVLALAGQYDKTRLMASGHDVYLDMANSIYNRNDLTKKDVRERTIGKNTVLGCGFQMGAAKFHARYCPDQPVEFAERVIRAYREEWAPRVPMLWHGLQSAAYRAVEKGDGGSFGVYYQREGEFLTATLPSGWQKLWYFRPQLDEGLYGPDWSYRQMKQGQWKTIHAYGGLLTENVVQALARGLLCQAIHRLEKAGYPVVLTVHDEIICEVPLDSSLPDRLKEFTRLMEHSPPWARQMGIPISVDPWHGERYRK